ncbi:putative methyltransferase C9orf114 homolog isoform X6 [Onychomys torridus]|uniref:putative methyltransferase C9orf114 homolog isoform X6 n=1 Tax=Onychomys torridus TaxID=38674 RepID=UPI00167F20B7|nr:putative methyltransferase C9orf114 homolog isoform X6 [Onychomys torridus]
MPSHLSFAPIWLARSPEPAPSSASTRSWCSMRRAKIPRLWKGNSRELARRGRHVYSWPASCSTWSVHRILNPLDSPHHMRQDEESEFREGVVVDRPTKAGHGSLVNCGMKKEVKIDKKLEPGLRVTVRLNQKQLPAECKTYKGTVVSSQDPRTRAGLYWGYTVRLASCLSAVFAEAPFQDGYDLTIGTSERGSNVASAQLPRFRHALVVFGGLQGLEAGVDADPNLEVSEPSVLFDFYVNTCPNQGSRTIRTEVPLGVNNISVLGKSVPQEQSIHRICATILEASIKCCPYGNYVEETLLLHQSQGW